MQATEPTPDPRRRGLVALALDWWPTTIFGVIAAVSLVNATLDRVNTEDLARLPKERPKGLEWMSSDRLGPYLEDRVAFRVDARRLHGHLLWAIHDGNQSVVRGREGWLFYADSLVAAGGPNWLPRRPARSIGRLARQMRDSGRPFLVVVGPNKASIYSRYLPPAAQRLQEVNDGRLDRVRKIARQRNGSVFVDLYDELRRRASTEEGGEFPLYFPTDTHWNVRGAAVAAAEIVERLGGDWEDAALRFFDIEGRLDLMALLGLPDPRPRVAAEVSRDGVRTERTRDAGDWVRYQSRTERAPLLPNLVVIHDSFGYAFRSLLPAYFESSTFVTDGAEVTEELIRLVDEADMVVLVVVERTFVGLSGRFPAPKWPRTRQIFSRWGSVTE